MVNVNLIHVIPSLSRCGIWRAAVNISIALHKLNLIKINSVKFVPLDPKRISKGVLKELQTLFGSEGITFESYFGFRRILALDLDSESDYNIVFIHSFEPIGNSRYYCVLRKVLNNKSVKVMFVLHGAVPMNYYVHDNKAYICKLIRALISDFNKLFISILEIGKREPNIFYAFTTPFALRLYEKEYDWLPLDSFRKVILRTTCYKHINKKTHLLPIPLYIPEKIDINNVNILPKEKGLYRIVMVGAGRHKYSHEVIPILKLLLKYKASLRTEVELLWILKAGEKTPINLDNNNTGNTSRLSVTVLSDLESSKYYAILKSSYLLVQPSRLEALSLPILEAMYFGKPVIAYDDGLAQSFHIRISKGGLLFKNSAELYKAILMLLNDDEIYKKLSNNARLYGKAWHYKSKFIKDKLTEVVQALIDEH